MKEKRKKAGGAFLISFLCTFMLLIFGPTEIFFANESEAISHLPLSLTEILQSTNISLIKRSMRTACLIPRALRMRPSKSSLVRISRTGQRWWR